MHNEDCLTDLKQELTYGSSAQGNRGTIQREICEVVMQGSTSTPASITHQLYPIQLLTSQD